jgi:hypothetical protein
MAEAYEVVSQSLHPHFQFLLCVTTVNVKIEDTCHGSVDD